MSWLPLALQLLSLVTTEEETANGPPFALVPTTALKDLQYPSKQHQHRNQQFLVQDIALSQVLDTGQGVGIKDILMTTFLLSKKAKKAAGTISKKPPRLDTVMWSASLQRQLSVLSYLGSCIGRGLWKHEVLTRASSFPWAVGPLVITVAVAILDLKAFGLFPTWRTVCVVGILKKKEHNRECKGQGQSGKGARITTSNKCRLQA